MSLEDKKKERFLFLQKIYDLTGGVVTLLGLDAAPASLI
jgi:hypothetical protein